LSAAMRHCARHCSSFYSAVDSHPSFVSVAIDLRWPINARQRDQRPRLRIHPFVVLGDGIGKIIEIHEGQRNARALGLVMRVLRKAAGAYVQTLVALMATVDKAGNSMRPHRTSTMFHFDHDSWRLEPEAVGGGDDVFTATRTSGRNTRLVAHGAQNSGNQF